MFYNKYGLCAIKAYEKMQNIKPSKNDEHM